MFMCIKYQQIQFSVIMYFSLLIWRAKYVCAPCAQHNLNLAAIDFIVGNYKCEKHILLNKL